jgi:hypothetical protein
MKGRRLPDTRWHDLPNEELKPGDYWIWTHINLGDSQPTNLTGLVMGFYSPDGNGIGTLLSHTVRIEDDGTVSVRPGDGSSNSILHSGGATGKSWHGYLNHGVWEEC